MTKTTNITPSMTKALEFAQRHGAVHAGANVKRGHVVRFPASVLRALERRGLLSLQISPDGGMMGTLAPRPVGRFTVGQSVKHAEYMTGTAPWGVVVGNDPKNTANVRIRTAHGNVYDVHNAMLSDA